MRCSIERKPASSARTVYEPGRHGAERELTARVAGDSVRASTVRSLVEGDGHARQHLAGGVDDACPETVPVSCATAAAGEQSDNAGRRDEARARRIVHHGGLLSEQGAADARCDTMLYR